MWQILITTLIVVCVLASAAQGKKFSDCLGPCPCIERIEAPRGSLCCQMVVRFQFISWLIPAFPLEWDGDATVWRIPNGSFSM
ncbi:hypothetical protein quinque_010833 [Culex quinquefasciatus]